MLDFKEIAKTKLEEVKAVPLLPVATYRWQVEKLPEIRDITGADGTEYQAVEFPIICLAVADDTDVSEFPADIKGQRQRLSFMFNKSDEKAFAQTQNQIKTFLVEHLKCVGPDASFVEGFNAAVKQQFLAGITHREDKKNPGVFRENVGRTAPLD
jgi:hypothetical protein